MLNRLSMSYLLIQSAQVSMLRCLPALSNSCRNRGLVTLAAGAGCRGGRQDGTHLRPGKPGFGRVKGIDCSRKVLA